MAADQPNEKDPQGADATRGPRLGSGQVAPRLPDTSRRSSAAPSAEVESVLPFGTQGANVGAFPQGRPGGAAPQSRAAGQWSGTQPRAAAQPVPQPAAPASAAPSPQPIPPARPQSGAYGRAEGWPAAAPAAPPVRPPFAPAAAPATPTAAPATPTQAGMATVFGLVHAPSSQPGYDPFAPARPAPTRPLTPAASRAAPTSQFDDPFEARRGHPASSNISLAPAPVPAAAPASAAPAAGDDPFARPTRPNTGSHSQVAPGGPASRPYVDPARSAARTSGAHAAPPGYGAAADSGSGAFAAAGQRDRNSAAGFAAPGLLSSQSGYAPGWPQRPVSQAFGVASASSPGFDPAARGGSTRPGVTGSTPAFSPHAGFDAASHRRASSAVAYDPARPRSASGLGSDLFAAQAGSGAHPGRDLRGVVRPGSGPVATPVQPGDEDFRAALAAMALQPALTDADVRLLASLAWRWQLGADESLYGQGDNVAAAFLLGDGILRLECAGPDGQPRPLGALKIGEWGGEVAFCGGGTHSTSAIAATEVTVYAFDMAKIAQLNQVNPGLLVRLLALQALQQARRQRVAQQRVDQLCLQVHPRSVEPAPEAAAPSGLGRLLSKLTGSKEEP